VGCFRFTVTVKFEVMLLLAILLPWLSFIFRGKPFSGIICLILQLTVIGWLPAAIWAVVSLQNARAERRNERLIRAIKASNS
jgi:uncharacterized membrane protein YqaE (UPF0057 family)